ncbi:hypothetical protein AB0D57_45955 [Streptomyces sp. NPDC048275]|uniref:hypothetical protein n=1 Tax=Streptomyces sp. NPDC048275 TaxID=3155629 RepID=UPI00340318ED
MSDSPAPWRRRWLAVVVFVLVLYVLVRAANTPQGDSPPPAGTSTAEPTPAISSSYASSG